MKKSKINTPVITGDKDTDASLDMERINQELPFSLGYLFSLLFPSLCKFGVAHIFIYCGRRDSFMNMHHPVNLCNIKQV